MLGDNEGGVKKERFKEICGSMTVLSILNFLHAMYYRSIVLYDIIYLPDVAVLMTSDHMVRGTPTYPKY